MRRADISSPRGTRLGVALAVAALHVALVLALIRAFAPEFTARVSGQVFSTFSVTVTTPPPPAPAPPAPRSTVRGAEVAGAAGAAGRRAEARPVTAPPARIVIATQAAPPVAGQGRENSAGARDAGSGTGAGGQGQGAGSGISGTGQGGGGGAKAVKIAGDINSTRDYPPATREQRRGDYVIVALTIGTDGRVKDCRVHRASKDTASDLITCRLATDRFHFRPATNGAGDPIESLYGWQQRWFEPDEKNRPKEKN